MAALAERRGSLTVVGTGISGAAHATAEARAAVEGAEEVVYLVADPATARFLERLNPSARSLHEHYGETKPRRETYDEIVEELLGPVRAGVRLCAVFYGHPGFFVDSSHRAIALACSEGFSARMLPAISALDCLVADLGIDPARPGLVSYEATAFLLHRRQPDTTATLVLWQADVVGERFAAPDRRGSRLPVLVEYLSDFYPADHETIVYVASPYSIADPVIRRVPLGQLKQDALPPLPTLVLPALGEPKIDLAMAERLGLGPAPPAVPSVSL